MNMGNDIQVSVCVVTYNQENYIADCLESLVTQKTNFRFEIIVGEDRSTDNTRSIVQRYVEKHPDLIVPLFYEKNLGPVGNLKEVYKKAQGKYIAHMDGDDLAMPNKLQTQFEILEENPECNICTHDMATISFNGDVLTNSYWSFPEGEYTGIDLLKNLPFFAHSSKFFRVNKAENWDDILNHSKVLDVEIHSYQALNSNIFHLHKEYGVYRKGSGVTALAEKKINPIIEERVFFTYESALKNYPKHRDEILIAYSSYVLNMANNYAVIEADSKKFREFTLKSINLKFFSIKQLIMFFLAAVPNLGIKILRKRSSIRQG